MGSNLHTLSTAQRNFWRQNHKFLEDTVVSGKFLWTADKACGIEPIEEDSLTIGFKYVFLTQAGNFQPR
jgi:hypothetical protein